ncbi:hypothetical protein MPTK2_8g16030 [Marchantia polymorpha subsp. ruderalis]
MSDESGVNMSVSGVSLPLAAEAAAAPPAASESLGPALAVSVLTSPMAPLVSKVDDGVYSIGPLKLLILWSVPAVTLYFLMIRFDSSCSSSTDADGETQEGCGCNVNIFCTTLQTIPLLVDGTSSSMNNSSSFGKSCQQIIGMSGRPEMSKSCLQESLVCAACVQHHATFLDNEDRLIRSIFLYPIKGGGAGHGHKRAMFAFEGGAVHFVHWQVHFPGSVGAAAASSGTSSSRRRSKLLGNGQVEGEDLEQEEEEEEESFVCLGLDAEVSGVTNLSAYFEMYHRDSWPVVASNDHLRRLHVPVPRPLADEPITILQSVPTASRYSSTGARALLGTSKKAREWVNMPKSLLAFLTWHERGSQYSESHAIMRASEDHADPSPGAGVGAALPHYARARQLMQDYNDAPLLYDIPPSPPPPPPYPPAPPPDQLLGDPYLPAPPFSEVSSNATSEASLTPVIIGPTLISVMNVSVYLTGILIDDFTIQPPPNLDPSNASEYQVVLQVDAGSLMVLLDNDLLPSVMHQVAVGNFWIGISEDIWDSGDDAYVPGAGIQWQCTIDRCNKALTSLSYGKGLGTGRKSKTVLTILVYPMEKKEPVALAKAMKTVTMEIAGAGAWFTIFQYTKIFYSSSLGVLGMGLSFVIILCCVLGCCVCWQNHKEKTFSKMQVIAKVEAATYDETRVFNPFWIPSAAVKAGDEKFSITPNPRFLQQLQSEHLTRLQSIGADTTLETMQFLAAAAAAAASSTDINLTTRGGGEGEKDGRKDSKTATETTVTRSSFGSPRSSASASSRTSHTSRTSGLSRTSTSRSTRFSVKDEDSRSGSPADTDESASGTPAESEDSE